MSARRDVAVIGLGAMGLPMAGRLARRVTVSAYDVDAERTALAETAGAQPAGSAAAAAAGTGVVVLAVRTLAHAEAALFGEHGACDALGPDAVVVLTSTVGSSGARLLAERCAERGIRLLDAPVSGGAARAAEGDLLVFLGGDAEAASRAAPVLELLASTIVRVGPHPGDGQALKIVNQLLCGVHVAAASEALSLARALGLDVPAALEALGKGAASSFMLENRGPRIVEVLEGSEPEVRSRVDIFVKDMGLVADAARGAGVPAPLAAAAEQLFRLAESAGLGARDDSALAELYPRRDEP